MYTPRAGLVTVSQSPFLEEASPLCSSLIWWPNLGTEDRTPTLKSPVYSLWGLGRSYPYKALGSNPAHDSYWQWVYGSRPKAPGNRPPSLIRKVGIQLGHIVGQEVCLGVWRININPVLLTQATLGSEGED